MTAPECDLCVGPGGQLLTDDGRVRTVLVDDAAYPGFVRVIWNSHVREMTDLAASDREHLMQVVFAVEAIQREVLRPHKMNVASLGNMTPHVHWHLIPRYADDAQFPGPIWAERRRTTPDHVLAARRSLVPALVSALQDRLNSR